ncbi:uncharacterized protein [Solanum lycopersicum]|uniref:uncharacterized protein n=1 Tax=Solanum lycopersicum TaxID=4081 RepID=UPI00374A82D3
MVFAMKPWRHYMYGVNVDVFTGHKSLQYVFTQRELNLRQRRLLQLLKYYDMNVHYHLGKANIVADGLRRMSIGSTIDVEDEKKELTKDMHRLDRLGVWLHDSTSRVVSVHPSYESSLVVELKEGQHLDVMLMELKDSALVKMNESFSLGDDGILRYLDRLCVPDVDYLRSRIIEEAHGSRYSIHPGSTKMHHDHKQIYWIGIAPFETVYGKICMSPAGWFEVGESSIFGPEIIHEALEKVRVIRDRMATVYSRKKSYADNKKRPLEFDAGDQVYLKRSHIKGLMRFCRKRKLNSRYVGPYEILQRVGEVAYELALPADLASVHPVFHVSMLKNSLGDPSSILPVDGLGVDEKLSYEEVPVEILHRQVRRPRNKEVATMNVLWRNHLVEGST